MAAPISALVCSSGVTAEVTLHAARLQADHLSAESRLLAELPTPAALVTATRRVREAGYKDFDAHSPFPVHGIDGAMGIMGNGTFANMMAYSDDDWRRIREQIQSTNEADRAKRG